MTAEEYLAADETSERPSEYLRGVVVPIEAATPSHGLIHSNFDYCLGNSIRRENADCKVRSQVRIYIPAAGQYTYPDLSVICGKEVFLDNGRTLANPLILIEILSPATHDYDCGRKFAFYRSIESLQEYVTVTQDQVKIDHWIVINGKWTLNETHTALDHTFMFLKRPIALREIYRGVELN